LLLILAFIFLACAGLDCAYSERGFAHGYVESNEVAARLLGEQPSFFWLFLFDGVQGLLFCLPELFFHGWAYGVLPALALKHLLSVRKWRKAFATNGASLREPRNVLQKFLGL